MNMLRYFIAIFILSIFVSVPAFAIDSVPTQTPKPSSPLLLTEFRVDNAMISYIQLYNNGDEAYDLSNWELVSSYADGGEYRYSFPNGYIAPGRYVVVSGSGFVNGDNIMELASGEEVTPTDEFHLISLGDKFAPEPVPIATASPGVRYHRYLSSAGNYTGTRTFSALKDQTQAINADPLEEVRESFPLAPIEILANPKQCAPDDTSADCYDYVKFYNYTDTRVEFDNVRLRVGYAGQSASSSNSIVLRGHVDPGEYITFSSADGSFINLTNSGAFVWLEYVHGVVLYKNTVVEYPDASNKKGQSWAIADSGEWQWAVPQPFGHNIFADQLPACSEGYYLNESTQRCRKITEPDTPKPCAAGYERNAQTGRCRKIQVETGPTPCAAGYYRHPETNRCRKIEVDDGLAPCRPDQYRSPETGRCRKILLAEEPKPCAPDQYRNPETGRCKKIASEEKLKPCAPGQERNPETNRCRKIQKDISNPGFKVEDIEASADAVASWWALGGVGSLAVGYAGWEWRTEMLRWLRRIFEFFVSRG